MINRISQRMRRRRLVTKPIGKKILAAPCGPVGTDLSFVFGACVYSGAMIITSYYHYK